MSDQDSLIGKTIRITEGCEPYFYAGDIGRINRWDGSSYWADFSGLGNAKVYKDGVWCTDFPNDSELIESEPTP